MSWFEFNCAVEAYKQNDRDEWHKVRVLASILLSPHVKKGKKVRPEDLIHLPDDVKKPAMSKERVQADVQRKMKAYRKRHG